MFAEYTAGTEKITNILVIAFDDDAQVVSEFVHAMSQGTQKPRGVTPL